MEQALARSRSAEQEKVAAVMVVKGVELEVEATVEDKMVGAATVEMRVGAATAAAMGTAETVEVMGVPATVGSNFGCSLDHREPSCTTLSKNLCD